MSAIIEEKPRRPEAAVRPDSADLRVTVLVDDHPGVEGLRFEHGLSLWIESGETRVLFDTGAGGALVPNAQALGIDLAEAGAVVLSHGHYDHTGGLAAALAVAPRADVFAHPDILRVRYSVKDGPARPAGIPREAEEALSRLSRGRFHCVLEPGHPAPRIGITGPIPRNTPYEDTGGRFYLDPSGLQPDRLNDDLALWIETKGGIVVCVGCAHSGIINTLLWIQVLAGGAKIRTVIGGFHLLQAGPERLRRTAAALEEFDLEILAPGHCTGEAALAFLRDAFPGRIAPGAVGRTLSF